MARTSMAGLPPTAVRPSRHHQGMGLIPGSRLSALSILVYVRIRVTLERKSIPWPSRFPKSLRPSLTRSARNQKYSWRHGKRHMKGQIPGGEPARRAYRAKGRTKILPESNYDCLFCWFVLQVYPTLQDMRPRDDATFREHLEKAHGLRQEIPA
jgi:hypothetical protein